MKNIFIFSVVLILSISLAVSFTYPRSRQLSDDDDVNHLCQLPPVSGLCKAYNPMYYHNATTNTCNRFVFGGCIGNGNRFESGEECVETCGGTIDDTIPIESFNYDYDFEGDPCDKPLVVSYCDVEIPRFYFDGKECTAFLYRGCGGNSNNFRTKEKCLEKCGHRIHVAAHFENKFRKESVRSGEEARLVCEALGNRPLNITWLKDQETFEPNADVRYELTETVSTSSTSSTLTIHRADRRDSALYTCIAANAFGRDDTNFQFIVQEPPDPPQDAKLLEVGSRTANIGWTPTYTGNSPILQYVLHYKEETDSWQQHRYLNVTPTDTNAVVRGLTPSTHYHFRVVAENALGTGEPSNVVTLATQAEAPGGPPLNVKAKGTGAHTIKVSWKPPKSELQYGAIEGYFVGYRPSGSEFPFIYKMEGPKEDTQLTGLKRLTEYQVVVLAFNFKGNSPPSDPVTTKTLENGSSEDEEELPGGLLPLGLDMVIEVEAAISLAVILSLVVLVSLIVHKKHRVRTNTAHAGKEVDELMTASSSSAYSKEAPEKKLNQQMVASDHTPNCSLSGVQRKSQRNSILVCERWFFCPRLQSFQRTENFSVTPKGESEV